MVKDEIDALVDTLKNLASKEDKMIIMVSVAYFVTIESISSQSSCGVKYA